MRPLRSVKYRYYPHWQLWLLSVLLQIGRCIQTQRWTMNSLSSPCHYLTVSPLHLVSFFQSCRWLARRDINSFLPRPPLPLKPFNSPFVLAFIPVSGFSLFVSMTSSRQIRKTSGCTRICKMRCTGFSTCGPFKALSSLLMQAWITCCHENAANKIHKEMVNISACCLSELMETWQ